MPTRLITEDREFASLRDAWNSLAGDSPFRRWEWMHSWRKAYAGFGSLYIIEVSERSGRVIGYAPFHLEKSWRHGACLRFLGSGKACGDDVSFLAAPGRGDEVVDQLVEWLTHDDHAEFWDWICLDGVSAADPLVRRFESKFAEQGAAVLRRDDISRWALDLPGDWNQFLPTLGKNTRKLARKSRQRLENGPNEFRIVAPTTEAECLEMFDHVARLHQLRWQNEPGGGCFAAPQFEPFLRDVVLRWFAEGSLQMRMVTGNGDPAAGAIAVAFGDTLNVYLIGRDPSWGNCDVGWILTYDLIHSAIAEGFKKIDFLRGDEPYKAMVGASSIPQVIVEIPGRGAFNRVRYLATRGRQTLKKLVRRKAAPAIA